MFPAITVNVVGDFQERPIKPFFMPSKISVNAKVYQEHTINDRLIPFLQDNYPNGGYVFWPDLVSAHYANATQNLTKNLGITFVPKDQNPPAAPEVRPIEKFWQHLKSRVYKGGWKAKNGSATPIQDPTNTGYLR